MSLPTPPPSILVSATYNQVQSVTTILIESVAKNTDEQLVSLLSVTGLLLEPEDLNCTALYCSVLELHWFINSAIYSSASAASLLYCVQVLYWYAQYMLLLITILFCSILLLIILIHSATTQLHYTPLYYTAGTVQFYTYTSLQYTVLRLFVLYCFYYELYCSALFSSTLHSEVEKVQQSDQQFCFFFVFCCLFKLQLFTQLLEINFFAGVNDDLVFGNISIVCDLMEICSLF